MNEAYTKGFIDGLTAYAWWKDGTQYVGSCGNTLKEAIEKVKKGKMYNFDPISDKP